MTRPGLVLRLIGVAIVCALSASTGPSPVLASGPGSPPSNSAVQVQPTTRARGAVLHRVVWDQLIRGSGGIHLRSAKLDGSDPRRVFDFPRGFTMNPTLDGRGRRVAFSTCCSDSFPQLVVAPVLGGKAMRPLAQHRQLVAVGGIGWSPDGRRLAFEAVSETPERRFHGIWSVQPNGRRLRLLLRLPEPGPDYQTVINDALAWTPRGVLYSDGTDLRLVREGRSALVQRDIRSVRISGDHRYLVIVGDRGDRTLVWRSDLRGRHRTLIVANDPPGTATTFHDVTPNYRATAVLATRMPGGGDQRAEQLMRWQVARGARSASALAFARNPYFATWN